MSCGADGGGGLMMQFSGSGVMKQHEGRDYPNWVSGAAEHRAATVTDRFSDSHTFTPADAGTHILLFFLSTPFYFVIFLYLYNFLIFFLSHSVSPLAHLLLQNMKFI